MSAGTAITLVYTLALSDGTVVDQATEEEPFHFVVGDGALIPALESVLIGLKVREPVQFLIAAEEAFGLPDPEQIHTMPRSAFQAEIDGEALAPGVVLSFEAPSGDLVPATIVSLEEEQVEVDFNHPLAGRDLQFSVEVRAIGEAA